MCHGGDIYRLVERGSAHVLFSGLFTGWFSEWVTYMLHYSLQVGLNAGLFDILKERSQEGYKLVSAG